MKLISFASFKGGAGKTTSLMAVTSGLVRRGKKVVLFEADNNNPLKVWRANAQRIGTWDDSIAIYDAHDEKALGEAYEAASEEGFDFALLDTRGGDSELNTSSILNADFVLVPTSLTPIDIEYVVRTLSFAVEAMKQADVQIPVACLLTQTPTTKQKASERKSYEILQRLPQMDAQISDRAAFADIFANGLLHKHHEIIAKVPSKKILAQHVSVAMKEAQALADELIDAMEEEEAA